MAADNKQLAKYLRKQIRDNYGDYYIASIPTTDEFGHNLYFFDETDGESYDMDGNVFDESKHY